MVLFSRQERVILFYLFYMDMGPIYGVMILRQFQRQHYIKLFVY